MAPGIKPTPNRSPNDLGNYRRIELVNGIDVLLICSRGLTTKCSFCVGIKSGSGNDPAGFHGLSHLMEHLRLFGGSQKFPEQNSLRKFLKKPNVSSFGRSNASTELDISTYYAEVSFSVEVLSESLDRFADLITNPTLNIEFIQREVISIENELHWYRTNNTKRITQTINSRAISGSHPLNNFAVGSKESLLPSSRSVEQLRDEAPANMVLVVQAPGSINLDELQKIVEDSFGRLSPQCIPSKPLVKRKEKDNLCILVPYSNQLFNRSITMKPESSDDHEAWNRYTTKPLQFLANAIADRQEGCLYNFLLSKNWITDFFTEIVPLGKYTTLFKLIAKLTDKGRDENHQVLEEIFGRINFLRQQRIEKNRFDKLQAIANLQFKTSKTKHNVNNAIYLAQCMARQRFDPKDLITGNILYQKFDPETIKGYLAQLLPQRACYVLITPVADDSGYQIEPLYNAKYKIQELCPTVLKLLENAKPKYQTVDLFIDPVEPDKILSVEEQNLKPEKFEGDIILNVLPEMDPSCTTTISLRISNDTFTSSFIRSRAPLFDVWANILISFLKRTNEYIHPFELGTQVEVQFDLKAGTLTIKSVGYKSLTHEMQRALVRQFFRFNCESSCEKELFIAAKEAVLHDYFSNVTYPLSFAWDMMNKITYKDHLSNPESYEILEKCTPKDLQSIIQNFREGAKFVGEIRGTVSRNDGVEFIKFIRTLIPWRPSMATEEKKKPKETQTVPAETSNVKLFPMGERCLRIKSFMPNEIPFVITNCYQLGVPSPESSKIVYMLNELLRAEVFDILRTTEQLGHVAWSFFFESIRNTIAITIQGNSERHCICYVDQRIEAFLETFYKTKLTREILKPLLKHNGIQRDPHYIQEYFRQYMIKNNCANLKDGYRKVSIQVCHEDVNNLCESKSCILSQWLSPFFCIGKIKAEFVIAGPSKEGGNGKPLFITSIEAFHKMQ